MILDPTVLILGAGASMPYRFPSGERLMSRIADKLMNADDPTEFSSQLQACGFSRGELKAFGEELYYSDRFSIDTFLETHTSYLKVGKAAIVNDLLSCEDDKWLPHHASGVEGWHRYFFDQMFTGGPARQNGPELLLFNKLTVVTFNFDRSFERGLFGFLKRTFPKSSPADLSEMCSTVPVIHVHGSLGDPDWLTRQDAIDPRSYGRTFIDAQEILRCVDRIRLVTDEIPEDDGVIQSIRAALGQATVVVFMGFAYELRNLQRLGIFALLAGTRGGRIYGTSLGLNVAQTKRVQQVLGGIHLEPVMAHEFIQRLDVLHQVMS